MRNKTLRNSYVRDIKDYVSGASLSIQTGTSYTGTDRYLHNSLIQWDVFPETNDTFIDIKGFNIYELITTGTLQKPAMEIRVFDYCGMLVTVDNVFKLADDSTGNTTARNIKSIVKVKTTDYEEIKENGTALAAVAYVQLSEPFTIRQQQNDTTMRAIALTDTAAPNFDNSATLFIDLVVKVQ